MVQLHLAPLAAPEIREDRLSYYGGPVFLFAGLFELALPLVLL